MNVEAPLEKGQSAPGYLVREFVHGGHLLALGTASIAAFSAILLGRTPTIALIVMAYLFSFGAYTINRSVEIDEDLISHPERTKHLQSRKKYLPYVAGSCFGIGYLLAAFTNIPFFLVLLAPLVLSLVYSVGSKKFVQLIGAKRFKEKLLVKNVVISLGWALAPLLVGLYYQQLGFLVLLLAPFVFLRLFAATIFFDARDTTGDIANGIKTIPTVYGFMKSFSIMDGVDFVSGLYILSLVVLGLIPLYASVMLVFPLYSVLYRVLALRYPSKMTLLCDVFCDGEYILWGPVLVLGRVLI
ncbi:MAG: UbiA family prenyltransferase [Nitrososphaerales archaeon]